MKKTLALVVLTLALTGCVTQQVVETGKDWCSDSNVLKRQASVLAMKQKNPNYVSICDVGNNNSDRGDGST